TPVATVVHVTRPDGQQFDVETDARGDAVLTDMARGTYRLSTDGQVVPFVQEVPLSRSQFVDVAVVTATDAAILATVALAAAGAVLVVGRRRTRRLGRHRANADGSAVDRADQVHVVGAR
ncbi:MAG: hypothetical protein L0K86_05310, partial [Actinomycetia bacterium]|nr:hypothetical protein [Actinomycetes bacterium]